jgi:aspartyl-tRNA(Asn)/glutamyl-tRNA(Gln) amidotransferase subunit A
MLSIPDAARALREGRTTAAALTEDALAHAAARPDLHAFAALLPDQARAEAAAVDKAFAQGQDLGPLMGIPIGVKDIIAIAGQPTQCGSAVPMPVATEDASAVARLRAGGAVIIGRLQTYEFATVGPDETLPQPPSTNPWSADHITGGSSSGSASAVAGGLLRAALGTDTGGSVRAPAAYCGCVGLKPTKGRIPLTGTVPLSPSLDHIGPLAASVEEAAILLDALSDPGWRPATAERGLPVTGVSIGYARDWFASDPACDPGLLRALDDAASTLSRLGSHITLVQLPDYTLWETAAALILDAEALAANHARIASHGALYGKPALRSLLRATGLTDADITAAWQTARLLAAELDVILSQHDAILTATTLAPAPPVAAFRGGRAVWTAMRTLPFNASGHPAISVPAGFAQGLPLGAQLIAAHGAEDRLIRIAHAFEQATDHTIHRPLA